MKIGDQEIIRLKMEAQKRGLGNKFYTLSLL